MTTIYDVARRSGVSPATVSRVLSGRRNVDPELSEKVRAAVAELGYRPNGVARNLRKSSTNLWAVVISDIENPFFTSLVRGLEDVAQTEGYHVVLCNSDEDSAKEAAYASAVLTDQMAGVVISPTSTAEGVHLLANAKIPLVMIDRRVEGVEADTVLVDNEHGAFEGVKHLIDGGYRRIACITGPAQGVDGDGPAGRVPVGAAGRRDPVRQGPGPARRLPRGRRVRRDGKPARTRPIRPKRCSPPTT